MHVMPPVDDHGSQLRLRIPRPSKGLNPKDEDANARFNALRPSRSKQHETRPVLSALGVDQPAKRSAKLSEAPARHR
eukprot:15079381-Alexandrium_andersonii.AAC.1